MNDTPLMSTYSYLPVNLVKGEGIYLIDDKGNKYIDFTSGIGVNSLGKTTKPILLKRGLSATIEEWLMSAEYIMAAGNENVILCERGIRTFETYTRNTLDLSAIPVVKKKSHLPVIVDPSHAAGYWYLVEPLAKAAVSAGADGLMIEVHNNPQCALSDGQQSVKPDAFKAIMDKVKIIAEMEGKKL